MTDKKTGTTAADQRGPLAPYQETGLSSLAKAELGKLTPSLAAGIRAHLEKKAG